MLASEINMINDEIVSKNILPFKKELELCALMKERLRWFYRNDAYTAENAIRAC